MKLFRKKRNRWLGLGSLLGALMLLGALHLTTWNNAPVENFNAGLAAYERRVGDQPEDCQGTWPDDTAVAAVAG